MNEQGSDEERFANELAGELSTLPQLAKQNTPEWGRVAAPLIWKTLKKYGDHVAQSLRQRMACGHPQVAFEEVLGTGAPGCMWCLELEVERETVARECAELIRDEPDDIDWAQGVDENVQKFRRKIATTILHHRGLEK